MTARRANCSARFDKLCRPRWSPLQAQSGTTSHHAHNSTQLSSASIYRLPPTPRCSSLPPLPPPPPRPLPSHPIAASAYYRLVRRCCLSCRVVDSACGSAIDWYVQSIHACSLPQYVTRSNRSARRRRAGSALSRRTTCASQSVTANCEQSRLSLTETLHQLCDGRTTQAARAFGTASVDQRLSLRVEVALSRDN